MAFLSRSPLSRQSICMYIYMWFTVLLVFMINSAFTGWSLRLPGVNGSFRQGSGCRLPCHYARNLGWGSSDGWGICTDGWVCIYNRNPQSAKIIHGIWQIFSRFDCSNFFRTLPVFFFFLAGWVRQWLSPWIYFNGSFFSKRAKAKGLWCDDHGCGRLESIGYRSGAWLFW